MNGRLHLRLVRWALAGIVAASAHGFVGADDPCPWPTPSPPPDAGWAAVWNPDVEGGFTNNVANRWVGWKDAGLAGQVHYAGSDRRYDGSFAQKLILPQPSSDNQEAGIYQQIYVVPGGMYTATVKVYLHFPIQEYNCQDLMAWLGLDPFGQDSGSGGGMVWYKACTQGSWLTASVSVQAVLPVMTISLKATRTWPWHGGGATVWFDHVTFTGPVPTEPPPGADQEPVDPETLIPPRLGPDLVENASFEENYSGGVSQGWNKWSTAGMGTWKRSQRVGKVGGGRYDCGGELENVRMNPKTALLMGGNPEDGPGHYGTYGTVDYYTTFPHMQDTIIVGRPYVDANYGSYYADPDYWGRRLAEQCKGIEYVFPRIDCWQAFNEPDWDTQWQQTIDFELAFAQRCHELGLKCCSLNLATGNPGDIWQMVNETYDPHCGELLAVADYLGHHVYGGPSDDFMVTRQNRDDACAFALRPRRFKDMYDRRGWRFPPVIATEGSTWGAWHGAFTPDEVAQDIITMGRYMNANAWWCGYTNFAVGALCGWAGFDIVGQYTGGGLSMAQAIGQWNYDHPADAKDGFYSQIFGAGEVHPKTSSELTPAGYFTGGINREVGGLEPGNEYLLICWMKYEFRGLQPARLQFHLGVDPTGQTTDGRAATIDWGVDQIADKAPVHEIFTHVWRTFVALGPTASIWLRASHPVSNPSFKCYVDLVEVTLTTATATTVRPDFDRDGDVDQADLGHWQACLTGAGYPQRELACLDARLDEDDDVDEDDFAVFQACVSGADRPPEPGCAD